MTEVMSASWAAATVLDAAGLLTFNPSTAGGDTYLETIPAGVTDDATVLITSSATTVEYGIAGHWTQLRFIVRGAAGDANATRARAYEIYYALASYSFPEVVAAGPTKTLMVNAVYAVPPTVERVDLAGRPEVVFIARMKHGGLL